MAGWTNISAWASALTTALNSLAAGSTATSTAITPPTNPAPFHLDLRLRLESFAPISGQYFEVHVLPAVDDTPTDYADITAATLVATIPIATGTSAKFTYLDGLRCPVVPFKIAVVSVAGNAALAASGNVLEYLTKSEG